MPQFRLVINLGNDAMQTGYDVMQPLRGKGMMQHYDRSTIAEEPIVPDPCGATRCDECNIGGCPGPVIDADQDQRDQLTTRLSLRSEK